MSLFALRNRPRNRGRIFVAFLVTTITLWASSVAATVMLYTDLAKLVELSDVIVAGRVVDQNTFYDEAAGHIATITTFEVQKSYFGDVDKTVQFRQWGGELNGETARIPGDASFEPYEECVLFLVDGEGQYKGMRYLAALGQSKFKIIQGRPDSFVVRNLSDLAFLDQGTKEIQPRTNETWSIQNFEPELNALIAGIKGGDQ